MGWKEKGTVVRKSVAQSGKFASMVLEVEHDERISKLDIVTFDCVEDFAQTQPGDSVVVTGRLSMNKLTSKDRQPVMIDGFPKYVPQLIATKVEVGLGQVKKPKPAPIRQSPEDTTDIPF